MLGCPEPRLWTSPLRELTPATSVGFSQIAFARDVLGRPLDPWQEFAAIHAGELLPDGRPRFRIVMVLVARQNGKALGLSTPILTANRRWVAMGDLRVGDRVYHPAGHPVAITFTSEATAGHDCYRVTTSDGRSVVADADHLWTVTDKRRSTSKGPRGAAVRTYTVRVLTTAEMLSEGLSRYGAGGRTSVTGGKTYTTNEYRFVLPTQEPLKSPDVDLLVDPYLLGAWLGDGSSASAALTCHEADVAYWEVAVRAAGYEARTGRYAYRAPRVGIIAPGKGRQSHALGVKLRALGVFGDKHVPEQYLASGTAQREALLQGLMDTDGSIEARRGQAEFCSTDRRLADAVLFLARSLGWRATLREGRATINGRDCGPKYRVTWTPTRNDPFMPFRLPRKAIRVKAADGGKGRDTISVASIEPVESVLVRCIEVDSPDGLFLAGRDLVPTHNTELLVVLTLYWQFIQAVPLILGTSTKLDYAKESWRKAVKLAERCADPDMAALRPQPRWYRETNGEQESWTTEGSRYKIAASNPGGGRSLTIDRLILDELRQHSDYSAWDAAEPAASPAGAQIWALSNAGDDGSIVLNELRDEALRYIDTGEGDYRLGLLEWSAPEDADPCDVHALAMANPNLGRRGTDAETLLAAAKRAVRKGGAALTGFKTEKMCINVPHANPAIDPGAWRRGFAPGDLAGARSRVALCLDVAPDLMHATLAAAAVLPDDRARLEVVAAWEGPKCLDRMRGDLPALLARVRPQVLGWLPAGPAAAFAADLAERPGWPPKGVTVTEIRGEATAVCMGFAEQVTAGRVLHSDDPLLNAHVAGAEQLRRGDAWVFSRRGAGHVDAAYAGAGAVHLARTLPPPVGRPRLIVAR